MSSLSIGRVVLYVVKLSCSKCVTLLGPSGHMALLIHPLSDVVTLPNPQAAHGLRVGMML